MSNRLLARFSGPVPRYTSYPTAPHFHGGVGCGSYAQWLSALGSGQSISLYIHIPYCDRLCWFCACHTKHTLRYEPIKTYLHGLHREIEAVGALVHPGARVSAVHFGGGSPTMLKPEDMLSLMAALRRAFTFREDAEISVEMDPNDLDDGRYDALGEIGLTRASLGVQDFDPRVQEAINRIQTFEQTRGVVEAVRARGARSVNCDILYGLPFQTEASVARTVEAILSLDPDRIALFGYAHVPWMKKHQTLINDDALPNAGERFAQMSRAADLLMAAGYQPIGIDHFAKRSDTLAIAAANGQLRRNFQGYTDDAADALIGLGASSISQLPQGYAQNATATGDYLRLAEGSGLAVVRGIAFQGDDKARAFAIERIMCDFGFSFADLRAAFPWDAEAVIADARQFQQEDGEGLTILDGDGFALTEEGRPFARVAAAAFDRYLGRGQARHSVAV